MNADQRHTAYATLQVTGDRLDPASVTAALGLEPTFSVRKGEIYRHGRRDRQYVGRTGVWNFSTEEAVQSDRLQDHLAVIGELLSARQERFAGIRDVVREHGDWAGVSCFWYGPAGAEEPTVPASFRDLIGRLGGTVETDFHRDDEVDGYAAAE